MVRELLKKVDLEALEKSIERNRRDRLEYISNRVEWMKKHPKQWSKEQNKVIDWQTK